MPEMQAMGRETKMLMALLAGLSCALVAVLVGKLTIVRPPDGAGVDVHAVEPSAIGHVTVDPPDYGAQGSRYSAEVPRRFDEASDGPAAERTGPLHDRSPRDTPSRAAGFADGSSAGPAVVGDGVRLVAAERPEAPSGEGDGDALPVLPGNVEVPSVASESTPDRQVGGFAGPPRTAVDDRTIRVGSAFVVVEGDTWWSIAERAYGDGRWYRPLYAWNKALDPRLSLRPGTRIVVPTEHELRAAWSGIVPDAASESVPAAGKTGTRTAAGPGEVVVREGDTLLSLARDHLGSASRWRDLHAWNRDRLQPSPGPLAPGTVLRLSP